MGRWVTSKGRKIYIPDEGEENPYKKYENLPRRQKTAGEEWERQVANAHRDYKIAERSDSNLAAWREQLEYGNGPKMARDKIALEAIKREQEKRSAAKSPTQINKDEDKKEKQIAANKKQADKLNGKSNSENSNDKNTMKSKNGKTYTIKQYKDGRIEVGYVTPSGKFVGKDGTNSMEKARELLKRRVSIEDKYAGSKITSKTGGAMDRGKSLDTFKKYAGKGKRSKGK